MQQLEQQQSEIFYPFTLEEFMVFYNQDKNWDKKIYSKRQMAFKAGFRDSPFWRKNCSLQTIKRIARMTKTPIMFGSFSYTKNHRGVKKPREKVDMQNVKQWMKDHGWTQMMLCERLRLPQSAISRKLKAINGDSLTGCNPFHVVYIADTLGIVLVCRG